jgi:hypothetical protein
MIVEPTTRVIAEPFIKAHHYSGTVPAGAATYFAGFVDDPDDLYCVSCYGGGANCHQASYLSRVTGLDITKDNLTELLRLCRIGEKGNSRVSMSQFLSVCHKLLKKMGNRFVVSFSDPLHSHEGIVYRASNFRHLGKTAEGSLIVQPDGTTLHARVASHFAAAHGMHESELGLKKIKTPAKDRWFIALVLLFTMMAPQHQRHQLEA